MSEVNDGPVDPVRLNAREFIECLRSQHIPEQSLGEKIDQQATQSAEGRIWLIEARSQAGIPLQSTMKDNSPPDNALAHRHMRIKGGQFVFDLLQAEPELAELDQRNELIAAIEIASLQHDSSEARLDFLVGAYHQLNGSKSI